MHYKACSSVDRASDSDSESQGFDSLHAYKLKIGAVSVSTFNNEKNIIQVEVCILPKNLQKITKC